ncbi:NAD-binding protein [Pseudonocardia eucalypti]|uniref:NAD-binding protein n=1 Tax=Pseudonocardia eucalypti TaxID=648755 RepID=A0ABP9Q0S0_9PSEU|nr:Trk K+ transport system NAD-binding subunit [Pseudonocardia eucalypti]
MAESDRQRSRFVVCGENPLAFRLAAALAEQRGAEVTVVVRNRGTEVSTRIAELPVRLIEQPKLSANALRAAGVEHADALALVDQDDVGNIHAALQAQELNPNLRLVIRFFNMGLGYRIRALFKGSVVLSDSATAAPFLVAAALGEVAPSHARLPGRPVRTAYVARRAEVPAKRVICGLAITDGEADPVRLPADEGAADLVLALGEGADPSRRWRVRRRARDLLTTTWAWLKVVLNRSLVMATLLMIGLLVVGTALFAGLAGHSWANSVYLTVLDVAGAADPELRLSAVEKIIQAAITVIGIAVVPVATAAVVDSVVRARLSLASGRPGPMAGHVVVVGLGNVGSRITGALHDLGVPVVGVELREEAVGVRAARALDIPVVLGNASQWEILREAQVQTSRALVAVTNDDVINLEAALHGLAMRKDLRVVLRLFDDDLAERVRDFGIAASHSVSFLAAPAFAAAMMQREVLATIPIGRRVLLLSDLPVLPGATMVGKPLGELSEPTVVRVLGLQRGGDMPLELPPPAGYEVAGGDRLLVVATRGGLTRFLADAGTGRRAPEPT